MTLDIQILQECLGYPGWWGGSRDDALVVTQWIYILPGNGTKLSSPMTLPHLKLVNHSKESWMETNLFDMFCQENNSEQKESICENSWSQIFTHFNMKNNWNWQYPPLSPISASLPDIWAAGGKMFSQLESCGVRRRVSWESQQFQIY